MDASCAIILANRSTPAHPRDVRHRREATKFRESKVKGYIESNIRN
jgi:hypothetical protein